MLLHTYITEQTCSFIWQHIKDIVLVGAWHFLSEEHSDSQLKKKPKQTNKTNLRNRFLLSLLLSTRKGIRESLNNQNH